MKEKYKKNTTQCFILKPPVTTIIPNKNITKNIVMKYPRYEYFIFFASYSESCTN